MLDPEYGPEGDWPDAPLLGLGFTLRLVTKLAAQVGGALAILPDRFEVMFPGEHETSATKGAVVGPAGFEPAT